MDMPSYIFQRLRGLSCETFWTRHSGELLNHGISILEMPLTLLTFHIQKLTTIMLPSGQRVSDISQWFGTRTTELYQRLNIPNTTIVNPWLSTQMYPRLSYKNFQISSPNSTSSLKPLSTSSPSIYSFSNLSKIHPPFQMSKS